MVDPAPKLPATADLDALGEDVKAEILNGRIEIQAMPRAAHGAAQLEIGADLAGPFRRGLGGPGGWWLLTDVLVLLPTGDQVRPDLSGWRKERVPQQPADYPIRELPDWVCEILSPSNRRTDLVTKRLAYERSGIPWYWQVDTVGRAVTVLELDARGYRIAAVATEDEPARLPPFDAIELHVGAWFPEPPAP